MKRCVVDIRRAGDQESPPDEDTPAVLFPAMAAVQSEDAQSLLRPIRDKQPNRLTARAKLAGGRVSSLSRLLRMIGNYGLVALKKMVREIEPIALATSFKILID